VGLVTIFGRAAGTRRGIVGLVVGLAGVGLAISAAFVGPARATGAVLSSATIPAGVLAKLDAIALRTAKVTGDAHPEWITVVRTTHGKALESATPGDTEPKGNGLVVYLITMKGHFTDELDSGPSGAVTPTGTYLSLVLSARSLTGIDFGLSHHLPPVSPASLGRVFSLAP